MAGSDSQPAQFEGLAALRKVAEYIEITQLKRDYPDEDTDLPISGPMVSSSFETVIIPVKASWGRDVPGGTVMALRGPLIPSEAHRFPFPNVFLQFARPGAKGGGFVSQKISDPSQLLFFSSTRAEDKGESDEWPAWPDIDYPLTGKPVPPPSLGIDSPRANAKQPDAARHEFGQRRFTLELDTAEEAVNLMHGRRVGGIEAYLSNVSLARGAPAGAQLLPDTLRNLAFTFSHAHALIGEGIDELLSYVLACAASNPGASPSSVAGLQTYAQKILDELGDAARQAQAALTNIPTPAGVNWTDRQHRLLVNFRTGFEKELWGSIYPQLLNAFSGGSDDVSVSLAKQRLNIALDLACRQVHARIDAIPSLFEQLLGEIENLISHADAKVTEFHGARLRELHAAFDYAESEWLGFEKRATASLEATIKGVIDAVRLFVEQSPKWLDEVLRLGLGTKTRSYMKSPQEVFGESLKTLLDNWTQWQQKAKIIIRDSREPELFKQLRNLAEQNKALENLFEPARAWRKTLTYSADFSTIRAGGRSAVERVCSKAHNSLDQFRDSSDRSEFMTSAQSIVETALNEWKSILDEKAQDFNSKFLTLRESDPWKTLEDSTMAAEEFSGRVTQRLEALKSAVLSQPDLRSLADQFFVDAAEVVGGLAGVGCRIEQSLGQVFSDASSLSRSLQDRGLEFTRALATGPLTDTFAYTRDHLGYYYDATKQALDVTKASALFNQLGGNTLNALSAAIPFDRLRDRLLPQLKDLDISSLFPDFGGLKLENLLKDLKIPQDPLAEHDWIKATHGFDRDRLTAWADVQIDKSFDDNPDLFAFPPVSLKLVSPVFRARSRLEVDRNSARTQKTQALLVGDWTLTLHGEEVLRIERGGLYYDSQGGFDFRFRPEDIRLAPALKFITDALQSLFPADSAVRIVPLAGGISATLDMPLPDVGTGAFTLTGISLHSHFDILAVPQFEVRTGVWLSKPERPFGLAILFLGGGGWFGVDVSYRPPDRWRTRLSIGISAGAFLAVNLGVAAGSVGLLFTVGLDFYQENNAGGGSTSPTIGLVMWGEMSIMGIASAYLRVTLSVTYVQGEMTGRGRISVRIRICWLFTLRVSSPIAMPFKRSGTASAQKMASALSTTRDGGVPPVSKDILQRAVDRHLSTLDW